MVCILGITSKDQSFMVRYLKKYPQPRLETRSLSFKCFWSNDPRVKQFLLGSYKDSEPSWMEDVIADYLLRD
jgi:hypothetical protein